MKRAVWLLVAAAIPVRRLGRTGDPAWLRGDIIGALGAVTGKRFGYDIGAWRQWRAEAVKEWSRQSGASGSGNAPPNFPVRLV